MTRRARNEPLFASERRNSSVHSEQRAVDEDTALLGNSQKASATPQSRYGFWRELGLFTWAVVATAGLVILAVLYQHETQESQGAKPKKPTGPGKRNLVFMVSDGMGPASLSMTRSFRQFRGRLALKPKTP